MVHFSRIAPPAHLLLFLVFLGTLNDVVHAGCILAGSGTAMCYSACNAGYVTCMAGCGLIAGVAGPAAGPAAAACSAVQGSCMTSCTVGGLAACFAPTP